MELTIKQRMGLPQMEMPCQDPGIRNSNMEEVALGYTPEAAIGESKRCIQCKNAPCVKGCPVGIDIPGFLRKCSLGEFDSALNILKESTMLPAICGRVCPQEKQCMALCTIGRKYNDPMKSVAIGRVERFLGDLSLDMDVIPSSTRGSLGKVAIVGSGPSGLTCGGDLNRLGYDVTIFEAFHKPGGVTVYGIPEFRLPKSIVEKEVQILRDSGVKIVTDFLVGRTKTIEELSREFDSIFIASGAGLPKFMGIPGEDLIGVFSANEFLTRANLMKAWERDRAETPLYYSKKVAVLGGGNVAMDAARTALRSGAEEVRIIYRRTQNELPARLEEVEHAMEEGIIFDFLTNPYEIVGDDSGRVKGLNCLRYELGEADDSGRRRPVAIEGSDFFIETQCVIPSLGNGSNPLIQGTTPGLHFNKWGQIEVDENLMTSIPGIFAGGDIVQGAATVILAMGDGRKAAESIDEYIKSRVK